MKQKPRCRWARHPAKYTFDGYLGTRLVEIAGVWGCSLALKECDGRKDPGCGHYEEPAAVVAG